MGFRVQILEPSALLPNGAARDARAAFERVWEELPLRPQKTSALRFVDSIPPLFIKGLRSVGRRKPQLWLRAARIAREVRGLAFLRSAGVRVPALVAWGEERQLGWPKRGFLVLRVVQGASSLLEIMRGEATLGAVQRLDILRSLGIVVRRLHESDVYHRDLVCRNVLVQTPGDDGAAFEIWLIDCPRARRGLPFHRGHLRRSDWHRLTVDALKLGATVEECRALLEAAPGTESEAILRWAQASVAHEPARSVMWRTLGR